MDKLDMPVSEIRYRRLFEAAREGILIIDGKTGAVVDANPFLTDNIGYGRDELLGKMLWQIGAFVDIGVAKHALKELESEGYVYYEDLQLRRKDGTSMDAEFIGNAYDVSGQRVYQCNIRDITDRRKLERLTRYNEIRLRALFDNITDVIMVASPGGAITYVNSAIRAMTGYEAPELIGRQMLDFVHADDLEVARVLLSETTRAPGKVVHGSLRVVRKDGAITETEGSARYLPDTPGINGIVTNLHDVSKSNLSRETLVRTGHLLSESQRLAHIGSWFWTTTGPISWSDEMYRIYGVQPETFVPTVETLLGLIHPDDRDKMQLWLAACVEHHNPGELDFRIVRPDGAIRFINGHGKRVLDAKDHLLYMAGTAQDVTDRVLIRQRLELSMESTVRVLADTVESRDPYTAGHSRRVAAIAIAIAGELGLSADRTHGLDLAASIHDIGKISIPAEILSKPGRLSPAEFELIKGHVEAGFNILRNVDFPWPLAEIVRQHHERLDGSGYPRGLKGDEILLESRILAVADVVESITNYRPYRVGLGVEVALDEITKGRGTAFDADVVDACIRLFQKKGSPSEN